jgi:hypothetical protein
LGDNSSRKEDALIKEIFSRKFDMILLALLDS